MRKKKPNTEHRINMYQNYGHIHDYLLLKETKYSTALRTMISVYQCSMCNATTEQKN